MVDIFNKNIFWIDKSSNICNFSLKEAPYLGFVFLEILKFFFICKGCNSKKSLNKIILTLIKLSTFFHRNPSMTLCLLFSSNSKGNKIFCNIYIWMFGNHLTILYKLCLTNYLSSQVSKNTLWSTPFGNVFMWLKSSVFLRPFKKFDPLP